MSVTLDNSEVSYNGDGTTTSFLITIDFLSNDQITVESEDTSTEILAVLTEGVEYTLIGGNPATNVLFTTAPTSNDVIRIYRETPKVQPYDYINNGAFLAEDHETALDKIVMMIQEIARDLTTVVPVASNAFVELAQQALLDNAIITINSNQRIIKRVKGDGGHTIADPSTPIEDGVSAWQELVLVGASDAETLTILNSGNMRLRGDKLLAMDVTLRLLWDDTNGYWIE